MQTKWKQFLSVIKDNDLVNGNVYSALFIFALPFLLANILQLMYSAVDLFIISRFCNAAGIAAVSAAGGSLGPVTSLIIGLVTGATIVVARIVGADQLKKMNHTVGSMIFLFTFLSVSMAILMLCFSKQIVDWLNIPPESVEEGLKYMRTCAVGLVFVSGYNVFCCVFRGMGDSKTPLVLIAVSCGVNICGDLLLIGVFKMGAAGAAYATVFAQAVGMIGSIVAIAKRGVLKGIRIHDILPNWQVIKQILKLGLPISLQEVLVSGSFLIIASIINAMGVVEAASMGVVQKLIGFAMLPSGAISAAIATMVAQNVAAGKPERTKKCLVSGVIFSLVIGIAFCTFVQISPETLIKIFSSDEGVVLAGSQYLRADSIDCIMVAFIFCFNGFFSGYTKTMFVFAHNMFATFCIRIPLTYIFSKIPGVNMFQIGLAIPIASISSVINGFLYYRFGGWKKILQTTGKK